MLQKLANACASLPQARTHTLSVLICEALAMFTYVHMMLHSAPGALSAPLSIAWRQCRNLSLSMLSGPGRQYREKAGRQPFARLRAVDEVDVGLKDLTIAVVDQGDEVDSDNDNLSISRTLAKLQRSAGSGAHGDNISLRPRNCEHCAVHDHCQPHPDVDKDSNHQDSFAAIQPGNRSFGVRPLPQLSIASGEAACTSDYHLIPTFAPDIPNYFLRRSNGQHPYIPSPFLFNSGAGNEDNTQTGSNWTHWVPVLWAESFTSSHKICRRAAPFIEDDFKLEVVRSGPS